MKPGDRVKVNAKGMAQGLRNRSTPYGTITRLSRAYHRFWYVHFDSFRSYSEQPISEEFLELAEEGK